MIFSGFLGAGKTTLLQRLLKELDARGLHPALVVNDFGEASFDAERLGEYVDRDLLELRNGCICCSLQGNLVQAALRLLQKKDRPDLILIEASGVSEPASVGAAFLAPGLRPLTRLEGLFVVADASLLAPGRLEDLELPAEGRQVVAEQIRAADLLLLNKVDLVGPEALEAARCLLMELRPGARIAEGSQGAFPAELFLNQLVADPATPRSPMNPDAIARSVQYAAPGSPVFAPLSPAAHAPGHNQGAGFTSWTYASDAPFPGMNDLRRRLAALPSGVLRIKGEVRFASDPERPVELQAAGRRIDLRPLPRLAHAAKDRAPEDRDVNSKRAAHRSAKPINQLVFIGTGLDPDELRRILESPG